MLPGGNESCSGWRLFLAMSCLSRSVLFALQLTAVCYTAASIFGHYFLHATKEDGGGSGARGGTSHALRRCIIDAHSLKSFSGHQHSA